jgi:hypothetical protein
MNERASEASQRKPDTVAGRFVDCGDETVLDTQTRLLWMKRDTWQLTGKWMNWIQARDYAAEMARQKYAGYDNWRLPSPAEAKSLYDRSRQNKDHLGETAWLDAVFPAGFGFLCWTSDVKNKIQGVRFGYRKGGIMFDNIYRASRGAARLVRSLEKET